MKYYISGKIQFVQGYGNLVESPDSATRMKHSEAQSYINIHPDHCMMAVKSGAKKVRTYIISTPQKFLGDNGEIVTSIDKAKAFDTSSEAFEYLEKTPKISQLLKDSIVISEKFKKVRRKPTIDQIPPVSPMQNNCGQSSERVKFSKSTRQLVLKNYSHICPICGKPIKDEDYTIDHIVPLGRGGTNDITNLRPTHYRCNQLKGGFLDNELMDLIIDVVSGKIYQSPTSDISKKITRGIVRGMIGNKNV